MFDEVAILYYFSGFVWGMCVLKVCGDVWREDAGVLLLLSSAWLSWCASGGKMGEEGRTRTRRTRRGEEEEVEVEVEVEVDNNDLVWIWRRQVGSGGCDGGDLGFIGLELGA